MLVHFCSQNLEKGALSDDVRLTLINSQDEHLINEGSATALINAVDSVRNAFVAIT